MSHCTLTIGGALIVRSDGAPDAEYALFDASDIELRAISPGNIREHSYKTTAERARDRLAIMGYTSEAAQACAETMQPKLAPAYARGHAAERLTVKLSSREVLEGSTYSAETKEYTSIYIDLAGLASDLGLPHAVTSLQIAHLANLLSGLPPETEVELVTRDLMANKPQGQRSHKRVHVDAPADLLAKLRELAQMPAVSRAVPLSEAELAEILRARAASLPNEADRARFLELAESAQTAKPPEKGPLADPALWAIETKLNQKMTDGVQEQLDTFERAKGRVPGTTYLRARLALALGTEPPQRIAEKVSALALSMTSFGHLELLAAEAWMAAGDYRRALPYARDLMEAGKLDDETRGRARAIVAAAKRLSLQVAAGGGEAAASTAPVPPAAGSGPKEVSSQVPTRRASEQAALVAQSVQSSAPLPPLPPAAVASSAPLPPIAPLPPAAPPPVPPAAPPSPSASSASVGPMPARSSSTSTAAASASRAAPPPPVARPASSPPAAPPDFDDFASLRDVPEPPPSPSPLPPGPDQARPSSRPSAIPPAPASGSSPPPRRSTTSTRRGGLVEQRNSSLPDPRAEPDDEPLTPPVPPRLGEIDPPQAEAWNTGRSQHASQAPPRGSQIPPKNPEATRPTQPPPPGHSTTGARPSDRAPASSRGQRPTLEFSLMKGASKPPYAVEDPPPVFPKAPLMPKFDKGSENAWELSLPPGVSPTGNATLEPLPKSVFEARIRFTMLSRALGERYRLRGVELRADVSGIEAMQSYLFEAFPNHTINSVDDARIVHEHGAFLSEILARVLDAEWMDMESKEVGHWAMVVPPATRVWPFGRVMRLISMGHRERDLVSYYLELASRKNKS